MSPLEKPLHISYLQRVPAPRRDSGGHSWGNEDVLSGIKVNTDAMAKMTQLVQEGLLQISE